MKFSFRNKLSVMGLIFLSGNVLAGNDNHFYVGVNLGIAGLMDNEKTNAPIIDKHDLNASGFVGGGLSGYDFRLCNQWRLGIEGFVNGASLSISDNQNYPPITSYTVKMRNNLGLRFLSAYEFTPRTLGHAIIGYSSTKFEINDNGNYGIVNAQFRKNGIQFGLGMMTAIWQQVSIRGDVLYTAYSSQTTRGITTTMPSSIQNYHNTLSSLEGNVALIYNFVS